LNGARIEEASVAVKDGDKISAGELDLPLRIEHSGGHPRGRLPERRIGQGKLRRVEDIECLSPHLEAGALDQPDVPRQAGRLHQGGADALIRGRSPISSTAVAAYQGLSTKATIQHSSPSAQADMNLDLLSGELGF